MYYVCAMSVLRSVILVLTLFSGGGVWDYRRPAVRRGRLQLGQRGRSARPRGNREDARWGKITNSKHVTVMGTEGGGHLVESRVVPKKFVTFKVSIIYNTTRRLAQNTWVNREIDSCCLITVYVCYVLEWSWFSTYSCRGKECYLWLYLPSGWGCVAGTPPPRRWLLQWVLLECIISHLNIVFAKSKIKFKFAIKQ